MLDANKTYRWKYHCYDWISNRQSNKIYEATGKYAGRKTPEGWPVMAVVGDDGQIGYMAADPKTIEEI